MKMGYLSRLRVLNGTTALADLAFMNLCLLAVWGLFPCFISANSVRNPAVMFLSWNVAYLLSVLLLPPAGTRGLPGARTLFLNCVRTGLVMALVHHAVVYCSGLPVPSVWQFALICLAIPPWLFLSRALSSFLMRRFGDERLVAFVGGSPTMRELRRTMAADRTARTRVAGAFDTPQAAMRALGDCDCQELYCCTDFPPEDLQALSDHCDNHLIRLYLLPDTHAFASRRMTLSFESDIPLLATRAEPLRELPNLVLKRAFDIVVSAVFLVTVFPVMLLAIAPLIKLRSPGPVFFRQRRNGLNGRDFTCLKFRTMRADPACDGKAATKDDPRKFPFGDFLRRHNLDEFPQFVNVLLGDMSVVGPRPHATWTTDAYRDLVNKYMVRLYAKPGITGWAQVNGCRGETKTTDDMVRRIHLDVWYVSHWSIALDVRIVWMTVRNMFGGDKGNAY